MCNEMNLCGSGKAISTLANRDIEDELLHLYLPHRVRQFLLWSLMFRSFRFTTTQTLRKKKNANNIWIWETVILICLILKDEERVYHCWRLLGCTVAAADVRDELIMKTPNRRIWVVSIKGESENDYSHSSCKVLIWVGRTRSDSMKRPN